MKKRKPRPGSKPFKYIEPPERKSDGFDPESVLPAWESKSRPVSPWIAAKQSGYTLPPEEYKALMDAWMADSRRQERDMNLSALGKARAKVEEMAGNVRSDAFDDWVERSVVTAREPNEWTQARVLYENYLAHVKTYGRRAAFRALSIQEAATETQWGRMMATLFLKKRRTRGWYYPLRCKRS